MAEFSDLQALGKITLEVDESNIKITLSSQCIKAQIFLVDRLRKETERQKEVCKYINNGNLKLQAEIKHAELELKSMLTAKETIKSSNVEIKKELLLAKNRKHETFERVEVGEKKYEELWVQCKKRYESIPFVKKWFELTNETQALKDGIKSLEQEAQTLNQEITVKKFEQDELDKKRIIELAKYLTCERPAIIKNIADKKQIFEKLSLEIKEQEKELETMLVEDRNMEKPRKAQESTSNNILLLDGAWLSLCNRFGNDQDSLTIPKLQRPKNDLDILAVNLEQIKKVATTPLNIADSNPTPAKNNVTTLHTEENKDDFYTSCFFKKSYLTRKVSEETTNHEIEPKKFTKKKLINILEDIHIDKNDARNIISSVNPNSMQEVNVIGANGSKIGDEEKKQTNKAIECDQIEEIDITASGSNNILNPPIQFLDITQENTYRNSQKAEIFSQQGEDIELAELRPSQEDSQKKRVSFDLPVILEVPEVEIVDDQAEIKHDNIGDVADVTDTSQMDASTGLDESFTRMRERILKQHKLHLSPDFTYTKKDVKREDNVVTSKFFHKNITPNTDKPEVLGKIEEQEKLYQEEIKNEKVKVIEDIPGEDNQKVIILSPQNEEKPNIDKPVSGFLFTHGPNGIPDSLDVSISTTGYEDEDFPHCIDSSLLLSPKADMTIQTNRDNAEVFSQELPNFLTGLRKTGLSFFGKPSGPDTNAVNQRNNFNFNFGGEEDKKGRGGLFRMFQ